MNPLPHHKGKLIIVSAPSGAGKTTLVQHLLQNIDRLGFSVSCTTRSPRHNETDGKDYYFISTENFQKKIEREEFAEWEEVYPDTFYGTLKSEIQRIIASGNSVIFDIDVMGGIRLKELYSDDALSIFIMPPSLEVLENRLRNRKTESEEKLRQRVDKARKEINMATRFD
ncbi:MAG: guanylate kinase, partial [Weeksellaceae bacterium]|nr:guanylate kinase [Weeksellaceae bacterium]